MAKIAEARGRAALAPQRSTGKRRVADLLRAGADVIAERGFEAATMAEIAARAGAQIGSLYRFFPNKDALADALILRYRELVDAAFQRTDSRSGSSTIEEFADDLLSVFAGVRDETPAIIALLDARSDANAWRGDFHARSLRGVIASLKLRDATLTEEKANSMAVVLLQNMKTVKSLDAEQNAGAIAELRAMTALYLKSKLKS
ncbi:MAG TPA: helix-turn-helix domain-containing protein [Candidatus Lustribacter sp.]|nr:helix-turn-helix domain-containing protein [Candidatus Lustribacter sp.]